jgi:ribonuclease E
MSDTTMPAGEAGGDPNAPNNTSANPALTDLPSRIRVHALAKLLSASSQDVMRTLTSLDAPVRSAQSSVTREVALRVAETLADAPTSPEAEGQAAPEEQADEAVDPAAAARSRLAPVFASASPVFRPPDASSAVRPAPAARDDDAGDAVDGEDGEDTERSKADSAGEDDGTGRRRRRRGRRGRGRGKGGGQGEDAEDQSEDRTAGEDEEKSSARSGDGADSDGDDEATPEGGASRRRRRRRRRKGAGDDETPAGDDDPPNTVVHVRESREEKQDSGGRDEVRSVRGSTRLEAKRQRRRDGRDAGRRRAPILSEAEFLARREAVDRKMIVREHGDRIQMGVLEDGVLVEHFVTSTGSGSLVGNVYLGRVQNVLPSMEAAFVDIGRGRNAVLYAGEVDWDAAGLEGKARKIEQALSTGDSVLVQVTKDPVGHKGARLTTQISLPGRFLVYVPGGGATGISRKLPENERRRLKDILKRIVPEDAGVIIRTASEGISEEELARDVRRLQAQWQVIKDKTEGANGVKKAGAPSLLYEEPDLLIKVVRDLFTEDFSGLVVQGDGAWDTIDAYVRHVAPDLLERLRRHVGNVDVFTEYRIEEQLLKALDRKVWLPSGGYLIIDRTEAMTVIDVNTGKFTGSGGNLEETVTRNNLESAEEIVRQLRLRDIGGIIVIDFIDMVLESNRDLVLRRLTECLGRDRTRHQVAEVTSLGLVQMTRKRVGTGLLEAFSASCEHCRGRGVIVSTDLTKPSGNGQQAADAANAVKQAAQSGSRRGRGRDTETKAESKPDTKVEEKTGQKAAKKAGEKPESTAEAASPVTPAADTRQAGTQEAADSAAPSAAEPVVAPAEPPAEATEPQPELAPAVAAVVSPAVTTVDDTTPEDTVAEDMTPEDMTAVTDLAGAEDAQNATVAEPITPAQQPEAAEHAIPVQASESIESHRPGSPVNGYQQPDDQERADPHEGDELEEHGDGLPLRRRARRSASRPAGPPVHPSGEDEEASRTDPGLEPVRRLT